jgi:hypothetical protein
VNNARYNAFLSSEHNVPNAMIMQHFQRVLIRNKPPPAIEGPPGLEDPPLLEDPLGRLDVFAN